MKRPTALVLGGLLIGTLGSTSPAEATTAVRSASRALPITRESPEDDLCAWPFLVDVDDVNIAYPDPNATYWAMPFVLEPNESLVLRGTYPSARFMAVTLYDAGGDTIEQLSDDEISPNPGSANPFDEEDPPSGSGRHWQITVVTEGASTPDGNVIRLDPEQQFGWLVYRVYLGNPPGDAQGGAPLPTLLRKRGRTVSRVLRPCTEFLPGTGVADLLNAALPEPVDVTVPPEFVRLADDSGLFANAANAYLSAFADGAPGEILVVRGKLPTAPDTGDGESVVGDFDLRYFSITSNLNEKPYPTVDGAYDAELSLDDEGYYTVVVARDDDVPSNATLDENVTVLAWGDGSSQAVLIRNMLPSLDFPMAIQDVTPSTYGASSDAATVMGEFYPRIGMCTTATFETLGAAGCLDDLP